jgi:nicotinamidase-related amidase
MRLDKENALLVVIDIQKKLFPHIHGREEMAGAASRAIRGFRALGLPVLVTEQVPAALGPTIDELRREIEGIPPIEKSAFSCCGEKAFAAAVLASGRKKILLCGIESHVCVYQTALDLIEDGYEVYLLADAVSSRRESDRAIALRRLGQTGVRLSTVEMALFEILREAGTDDFRKVLRIVK